MAFALAGLALVQQQLGGKHRVYEYRTTDSLATVLGASYFTTASKKGMTTGDEVIVIKTDDSPPVPYRTKVSSITSDAATVVQNAATNYQAFFGATPIVQPAATAQSAVASTTLTALTAGETLVGAINMINTVITRVEAVRVLQSQTRTDLINLGLQKGSA